MSKLLSTAAAAGALCFALAGPAAAEVTAENFLTRRTSDLVEVCAAGQQDRRFTQAINFCHGFFTGMMHYHDALASGRQRVSQALYCLPAEKPTYVTLSDKFVDWARAHPQYMDQPPIETAARYMIETYPCRAQPARRRAASTR